MKVHSHGNRRLWYDFTLRMWTLQTVDEAGNQVGDVTYEPPSRASAVRQWLRGSEAPAPYLKTKGAEYAVTKLREVPIPTAACDTPDKVSAYYREHIETAPMHRQEQEQLYVLFLNTRRTVTGYTLISLGTLDTIMVHPREVFRAAIIQGASAIVLIHNHPSGDPTPSEADVKTTRDMIRAGQLLKIEVLDHVIMGDDKRTSLRELGYFYS